VAGCTAAGSVVLTGAGVTLAYADRHPVPASLTGWTISNLSGQVVNAAVPVVGLVLATCRPENRIGWLFLAAGLALGLSGFSDQYALHALVADPGSWPAGRATAWLFNVIWVIPPAVLAFVLLLFPTGHVRSRRWRLAGWFIAGAFTLATAWALIAATSQWAYPFTSPFSQPGGPAGLNSAIVNVLQTLAFVGLWTAIAIAVLKYRLYDIDQIISRTLAYAIVTGVLVGLYASLVLLATQVLTLKSPVAVAGSTLVAAALTPVHAQDTTSRPHVSIGAARP